MAIRLPFVSRGRYEDMAERVRVLEAERRTLVNRLVEASGGKPVFRSKPVEEPAPQSAAEAPAEKQAPMPTRVTFSDVRRMANEAKRKERALSEAPTAP